MKHDPSDLVNGKERDPFQRHIDLNWIGLKISLIILVLFIVFMYYLKQKAGEN